MPSIHTVKSNKENTYYHVYNRGTDKKDLFLDYFDYLYYFQILRRYLCIDIKISNKYDGKIDKIPNIKYIGDTVELHCYCVMPNHIHFLFKQIKKHGIQNIMKRTTICYSMYYNKKYNHSGRLFQGIYKAREIKTQKDLEKIITYIHENPIPITGTPNYKWSSYGYYNKGLKGNKIITNNIYL